MAERKSNTKVWDKLYKKVHEAKIKNTTVKVGVLASAGKEESSNDGIGVAEIAAIHEFGSPAANIPERSFIRRTFELRNTDLVALTRKLSAQFLADKITIERALSLMGEWAAAAIKNTIVTEQVVPRLEESEAGRRTIARKGSSVTLVDTGRLVGSISYQLKKAGEGGNE